MSELHFICYLITAIDMGLKGELAQHGGGEASALLCNKAICNVLHGTITLQWVCGAIQCMKAALCISYVAISSKNTHIYPPSWVACFTSTMLD